VTSKPPGKDAALGRNNIARLPQSPPVQEKAPEEQDGLCHPAFSNSPITGWLVRHNHRPESDAWLPVPSPGPWYSFLERFGLQRLALVMLALRGSAPWIVSAQAGTLPGRLSSARASIINRIVAKKCRCQSSH
jgi:hypothetical protein